MRCWKTALDQIYDHHANKLPSNYTARSETEKALMESLRQLELQCKERIDLLEALRLSREDDISQQELASGASSFEIQNQRPIQDRRREAGLAVGPYPPSHILNCPGRHSLPDLCPRGLPRNKLPPWEAAIESQLQISGPLIRLPRSLTVAL